MINNYKYFYRPTRRQRVGRSQAPPHQDQLHRLAARGAGEGVPGLPLPGCLHEGGPGPQAGPGGEQGAGQSCLIKNKTKQKTKKNIQK